MSKQRVTELAPEPHIYKVIVFSFIIYIYDYMYYVYIYIYTVYTLFLYVSGCFWIPCMIGPQLPWLITQGHFGLTVLLAGSIITASQMLVIGCGYISWLRFCCSTLCTVSNNCCCTLWVDLVSLHPVVALPPVNICNILLAVARGNLTFCTGYS